MLNEFGKVMAIRNVEKFFVELCILINLDIVTTIPLLKSIVFIIMESITYFYIDVKYIYFFWLFVKTENEDQ